MNNHVQKSVRCKYLYSFIFHLVFIQMCFLIPSAMGQSSIIYQANFEETAPLDNWTIQNNGTGTVTVDTGCQSTQSVLIERPVGDTGTATNIQIQLPVEKLRGYRVRFSAMVKAESITDPPNTWTGIKFMVPITASSGNLYPQSDASIVYGGDFDWTLVTFYVNVPTDATAATLLLGLESSTGKVWFDNVIVSPVPDLIYQTDFQQDNALSSWTFQTNDPTASSSIDTGYQSTRAALIERLAGATGSAANIQRALPVESLRGCRVCFSAMVKAENVSQPPNSWTGIKFMVPITAPSGNKYPQANISMVYGGNFDWTPITFYVDIPADAASATLLLGLEASTGKVWFDDVVVSLDKFHKADFQEVNPLNTWTFQTNGQGTAVIDTGYQSTQAVLIERPVGDTGTAVNIQRNLPIDCIRGCILQVSAQVKAEYITQPSNSSLGIKLMLPITTLDGNLWPQASVGYGTFDWQRITFLVRVPENTTDIKLVLGLEGVTGKVWLDDISISVRRLPITPIARHSTIYKGHNLSRLRGTMTNPALVQEDLRVLGIDWNANVIRWQVTNWNPVGSSFDPVAYDNWLNLRLQLLDAALPWCQQYGLKVVIDLHAPPRSASGGTIFTDSACMSKFVETWQSIANRYKNSDIVWAYDLANEPVEGNVAEDCLFWDELAQQTAQAILAIDPDHAIIVEPPYGGNPYGFDEFFQPLSANNIVYSMHMYLPLLFTHQDVIAGYTTPYEYPGSISGTYWDIDQMRTALKPVIEFQRKYGVHIYVGEFSAVRWAPNNSACNYISDAINVFEENEWDWTYHAFRESNVWSLELGEDRYDLTPPLTPTARQILVTGWFAGNQKP